MSNLVTRLNEVRPLTFGKQMRAISRAYGFAKIVMSTQRERWVADGFSDSKIKTSEVLKQSCRKLVALHGIKVRVHGTLPESPSIIVSNHLGYLDPLVLASVIPCVPVAKIELSQWPLLGSALKRSGLIFVDRDDPVSGANALRRARAAINDDVSVLVFPEGTTTLGDVVLPFKRGIFGLAKYLGVPVVPVAMGFSDPSCAWIDDDGFLSHYLGLIQRETIEMAISFGSPLTIGKNARETADAARTRVDELRRMLWS